MTERMRTGICIVIAGALIAAAILVTHRYSVGRVEVFNDDSYVVYGVDSWTGRAFAESDGRIE